MDQKNYIDINAAVIDQWVAEGWKWGVPVTHEEFTACRRGTWRVLLTPTKYVPPEWFPDLRNKAVLGLACGGGQQMPVFAACGARCTVLDYSDSQLESERTVAAREGYEITVIKADMTQRLPFEDGSFDVIFHPVSNCYIEKVEPLWQECFRVLAKGGILLAGMDNGLNFLIDEGSAQGLTVVNKLPFNPLKDKALFEKMAQSGSGIQFSHSLEEQIGGQLKAGFMLTDLFEDYNDEGTLRNYAPTYFATRSVKPL